MPINLDVKGVKVWYKGRNPDEAKAKGYTPLKPENQLAWGVPKFPVGSTVFLHVVCPFDRKQVWKGKGVVISVYKQTADSLPLYMVDVQGALTYPTYEHNLRMDWEG